MTLSMYQASVPVLSHNLKSLDSILAKAKAHAEAQEIDPAVLLNARLYPDMFPMLKQVQIATDIGSRGICRIAGREPESMPDTETTFDELRARVRHALEQIESFRPEQIDGSEQRAIRLKLRNGNEIDFNGQSFLLNFILPNLFFHITTAYDILRHNGVPLGKSDFLGRG
ncbi:MAG: DUF1993 domain-containing protein [Gammaproteobacteria bacterium]|nr:DUF1993 domain-containing protein [Gammaproteobacteria bacterium]